MSAVHNATVGGSTGAGDYVEPFELHPSWTLDAACQGEPTELFFPPGRPTRAEWDAARLVCNGCTVRRKCLAWVLDIERSRLDRFGMFGGLAPYEREAEARRRRRQSDNPNPDPDERTGEP